MSTLPAIAETSAASSEAAPEARSRTCPNCGGKFSPPSKGPGQHKRFCEATCRLAFANRSAAEGKVVSTLLKVWRARRGSGLGADALKALTPIVDLFNAEDKRLGRPTMGSSEMDSFIRALIRDPYIDRRR